MPRPGLSYDHKVTIMRQLDAGMYKLKDVPSMAPIAHRTIQQIRRLWLNNDRSLPLPKEGYKQGRPVEMPEVVHDAVEAMVVADPSIQIKDIKSRLAQDEMDFFSATTYHRLKRKILQDRAEQSKSARSAGKGGGKKAAQGRTQKGALNDKRKIKSSIQMTSSISSSPSSSAAPAAGAPAASDGASAGAYAGPGLPLDDS